MSLSKYPRQNSGRTFLKERRTYSREELGTNRSSGFFVRLYSNLPQQTSVIGSIENSSAMRVHVFILTLMNWTTKMATTVHL
jgi:ribosomal protein L34